MERWEAIEILGLPAAPTAQEIEHRYDILVKRFRYSSDPKQLDQVTEAYNLLTGRTYVPEPPDPRDDRVLLGKPIRQWKHIWHYGKMKYLAITVGAALVISFAWSVITNTPPDLKFVSIGTILSSDGHEMEAWLATAMPEVKKLQFDNVYLSPEGNGATDVANIQKAFVLLAAADEDVVAVDDTRFSTYVTQGAFLSLDDFWTELKSTLPKETLDLVVPRKGSVKTEDGGDGVERIYGLDITGLGTMTALGIYGESGGKVVFTISVHTKHEAAAKTFLRKYLEQTEELKALVTPIPTFAPTAAATATATPAA